MFQLKLISEMFEMFALLILNFNHLWRNGFLSFNKLYFLFLFTCTYESLPHRKTLHNLLLFIIENLPQGFAARICRGYLPREFAVAICRGYFLFVFVSKPFFCICEQMLFIWNLFSCEQNFFICEIFFINSVPFCYCCDSYGPSQVAASVLCIFPCW